MDLISGVEDAAILQLRKWAPLEGPLNLSEFRQAFISPTREQLLLLSYECEALLIPLVKEQSIISEDSETCEYDTFRNPSSSASCSLELAMPSRLDTAETIPSSSGSVNTTTSSTSNRYPFVYDVNSLAWGLCGDTYNQHEDAFFKELLFVSGSHGVTVHAFGQPTKISRNTELTLEDGIGEGMWVEWGPSPALAQNTEKSGHLTLDCETSVDVLNVESTNRTGEGLYSICVESGVDELSDTAAQKQYLRTFLTKVKTMTCDGKIWTRFPDKSSFPSSSAIVVSFSIFDNNSPILEFLCDSSLLSDATESSHSIPDVGDSTSTILDAPTNSLSGEMSNTYKCSHVFSNNSNLLAGFVLTLVGPVSVDTTNVCGRKRSKNYVIVARLDRLGIQWLCSVKLDDILDSGSVAEWTDFGFSDNFLICLNSAGFIFLYGAISGEYVTRLDILQICGMQTQLNSQDEDKVYAEGDNVPTGPNFAYKQDDGIDGKSSDQVCSSKRMFKRLLVASNTSLLSVIDEYGVTYVVCGADHIPEKYSSFERFPTFLQKLNLGILVGQEVSGFEIGHQRAFYHSDCHKSSLECTRQICFSSINDNRNKSLPGILDSSRKESCSQYDSYMTGFSAASQMTEQHFCKPQLRSGVMRNIILPLNKYSKDDIICFSPTGITSLIAKRNARGRRSCHIVHSHLHVDSAAKDDQNLNLHGWEAFVGEGVGCIFKGCFYLVTKSGLSVVLPSVSVSSNFLPIEAIGHWQPTNCTVTSRQVGDLFGMKGLEQPLPPWRVEVLDRILLYEGPKEADCLCLENGWDLKISRMRRLQLALSYMKFEDIENSLEMLAGVNLAEEGVLRLLFAAVYLMFGKVSNDNEVSAALRLLALATRFATKMIRKYGYIQHKNDSWVLQGMGLIQNCSFQLMLADKEHTEVDIQRGLSEMAYFLEIIRNLQCRINSKFRRPGQADVVGTVSVADTNLLLVDNEHSIVPPNASSLSASNNPESHIPASSLDFDDSEKLALMPLDSLEPKTLLPSENAIRVSIPVSEGSLPGRKSFPFENPKDMITRWEVANMDLKTVVRDALISGRLPLAVLQLHLHQIRDMVPDKEPTDTFAEVREIGRAIAYDLFLEGEIGLAVETLQKLGEDIETTLKQLAFGTVRRSLRQQITEEMKRYGYLGPYEWNILEQISLIEMVYPCGSFWRTFHGRMIKRVSSTDSPEEVNLRIYHSKLYNNLTIECGEIDGVVLGSWTNSEHSVVPAVDNDGTHGGYWAAAAVWFDSWDQITIDRVVLDQPKLVNVHVLWESQLEYHMCHNDWAKVSELLNVIPSSLLCDGGIQIALDGMQSSPTVGCRSDFDNYIGPLEELDPVCYNIPDVRIFRFSANGICSMWLRTLMEQQLAKELIFLKEYWEGPAELISILARSGFVTSTAKLSLVDESFENSSDPSFSIISTATAEPVQALHKLVVNYCARYNLPNLLDLYLDYHNLGLENRSLPILLDAAGDSQWAEWLLLSRVKGHEYSASFSNARSITTRNIFPGNNLSVAENEHFIHTVDDIAEGGGEIAALATLMYAPVPIQDCLSSGSVNRNCNSSAQCTLENLRPALQHFPTLWRTLVAGCFGQDTTCNFQGPKTRTMYGSDLSDYLNWRENIFFSAGGDTSLLQMLPCWFSKAIRRLVQLYLQGPLGWQSVANLASGESYICRNNFVNNTNEHAEISAMSWEAAIQKHVEEELCSSSVEETGLGLEHHLHRGRALAAFNHLLAVRAQKLLENNYREPSGNLVHGQKNFQSDVQIILAPLTQSEASLLSSVLPLAIMHFEDSVLVASCAFLLELCGLSASMLRIDVAALRRISSFYKSSDYTELLSQLSPKSSAFHTLSQEGDITNSLARALADDYLHHDGASITKKDGDPDTTRKQSSRALMLVLQHLEKASLPLFADGKTCGSWLLSGNSDGAELRSQQKVATQHWSLVTIFCQMHQIPLSTKYLAALARDNDWIGFLSEAQVGGYTFDTVIQIASKEFSNPRLKVHIVTVLKAMQSKKKVSSSSNFDIAEKKGEMSFSDENTCVPVELFGILAECENQKYPGEALLLKAKDLCWSILAMIASCFPDVSPLSCLTVWLEITAARETSSIKVNDIASQIANNVGAAVEATNSLPASSRVLAFHYNRRIPKRRRLMESFTNPLVSSVSDVSSTSSSATVIAAQSIISEEEIKRRTGEDVKVSSDSEEVPVSLTKMVAVLCEQRLFLPLLRAFEIFLPSCSLLPFIRALQAFSQMRLSEASAHLGSFSARIKDEQLHVQTNVGREGLIGASWISSTAVKAADAILSTCPSPYEKRCLLQLLASTDFCDGGSAATFYKRLYWKINLAEPSLRRNDGVHLGTEALDDASLLTALENNGQWDQARNWAKHLESSGGSWKSTVHHVTEMQAESMVAEWKEFLWDVPEERVALWGHCQTLFLKHAFPALQAGLFFLKHAESAEKDLPAKELHELLLLSLQWLSGMITLSNPVYPLHLLREIETRVWLLAVESEAQVKSEGELSLTSSSRESGSGKGSNIIDWTASIITKMDNHINSTRLKTTERNDARESQPHHKVGHVVDSGFQTSGGANAKSKRRAKSSVPSRRPLVDSMEKINDIEDGLGPVSSRNDLSLQDENFKMEASFSRWEESVGPAELERAVLSLLEFGQITASKQLQHKLSPGLIPSEFILIDAALKVAAISTPSGKVSTALLDEEVRSVIQSYKIQSDHRVVDPLQVLESLASILTEGDGRGLCKRIIAVVKAANVLGVSFLEAFEKQPIELLQLLSLKAQDSFEEAYLLVQTHSMPAANIAQILAESFLKGLLAAHRGGYMDSQKEEGPAPLLWRFSDFLKWAELCPSEPEIGHALMRLVITGQEIPHACEVELLILSHHFYKSSACLDGVDVLVALAATRVEAYVSEGDFPCLARLITGVGNFHALNFILGILIENGQLDLLLQKFSAAADTNTGTAEAVRGFRMAVLTSLKHFNPNDLDAFAMVYNHFDMKHETASLLESRAEQSFKQWFRRYDKDQNEDLLESMRYYIEAAEVHSSIDAGNKTRTACAQASLVSLQIRMPDFQWLNLSDTNARRAFVEQSRFQEALIVAEAYGLNQPSEWALVLWNQMLKPELTEQFVAEFVAVLPLQPSMLAELARFYRAEVVARGDQSQFSVWLTGGGLPAEWAKYLGRSFRCLLKRTRDLRLRLQLATVATGFGDVVDVCTKSLDKVPENAGPLVLRKGHGGGYLPLM